MWRGLLQNRCYNINNGSFYSFEDYKTLCTDDVDCIDYSSVGNEYVCAKSTYNPNNDVIKFDNVLNSLLVVFITITMEGWTDCFLYLTKTLKSETYINLIMINLWFISLIFIGGYLLISMFLAVVKSSFTDMHQKLYEEKIKLKPFSELKIKKKDREENEKIKEKELLKKEENEDNDNILNSDYLEVSKGLFNYSIVKDISILKSSNSKEIYLLKNKIKKNNEWIKKHEKLKNKFLRTETIDFNQLDDTILNNHFRFIEHGLDYRVENVINAKRRTLNAFQQLNKETKCEFEKNFISTYDFTELDPNNPLTEEELPRKSRALTKGMDDILYNDNKTQKMDLSDITSESNNSSDLSIDSIKMTKVFRRKAVAMTQMMLKKKDNYLLRFRHNPWEFPQNCDDIEFGNKYKINVTKFNGKYKNVRNKSVGKSFMKYQLLSFKDVKESKAEIMEKKEKSKYYILLL